MTRSIIVAFFAISLPYCLTGSEPSAFGAGDLNSPKPYGLTSTEEILLENKQNLHKVVVKSNNQANAVDSLRERIDGLQTIIEGISASSRNNKLMLKELEKKNNDSMQNSGEFDKRLTELIQDNSKRILVNTQEIEKINPLITEMSKLIDTINATYVTKNEFNSLVNDFNKFKDLVAKELKAGASSKKTEPDNLSSADIAKNAKAFYDKKLYDDALEQYNCLIKKNYKPAEHHYMIGEIEYYRKNYAEAIAYFKKSAELYSKASYMPVLLLHTAISMDETGDKKNAEIFYNAVISKYSDSSSAKTAKSKLSLIK